jgi:hypothetical protein
MVSGLNLGGSIFIRMWIRLNSCLPIFIRTFTSGISPKILDFYPHRPEAFSDFYAIFIRTWLRDLVEISGVLLLLDDRRQKGHGELGKSRSVRIHLPKTLQGTQGSFNKNIISNSLGSRS